MAKLRVYSPGVRVGNWIEELNLEEEALRDFLQRKERGELTVQKHGILRHALLRPVSLSVTPDGLLRFGDTVQLLSARGVTHDPCDPCTPCALSIIADLSNITSHLGDSTPALHGPCQVGGARGMEPCVRNSFIITSVDETSDGEILRYEQSFALRTTSGSGGELYLASDHRTFQKCAKKSRLQEVNLVQQLDFLCWWRPVYFDPQERLEHEGFPVQVNSKLLLSHCKTNQCLAAMPEHTLWTPFGRESEVAAHTFLDSHKAEQVCNHWIFMTAEPGEAPQAESSGSDRNQSETSTHTHTAEDTHTRV
ncbi:cilia- and flagella-associated protein 161 [Clarias gariepinus]|uniref:cilia- and flagella-associated protein 161 n=1 Tax=Clarias gariepinus TaxID=13013 RepID=UPI00234C419F|nr:cilia- and flagella-associated protein 161 [Clarias gariepinus]